VNSRPDGAGAAFLLRFLLRTVAEVIPLAEKAIRVGPRDPSIGFRYLMIGEVYELQARPDEAIVWFEKRGVQLLPCRSCGLTWLPPTLSEATWRTLPPTLPKPAG
jgi:hypothetical protein